MQELIICGDSLQIMETIPNSSIDMVFTDPPYADRFVPLYEKLGRESARILIPGGSLLVLCGIYQLPQIINALAPHLEYYWCCSLFHLQSSVFLKRNVRQIWKPILWFTKGKGLPHNELEDGIRPTGAQKNYHWQQQAESWALHFIETLVPVGGTVLDPFVGTGTTAAICKRTGRGYIGIDIDPKQIATTLQRLELER
jgi:DNA modification methylase